MNWGGPGNVGAAWCGLRPKILQVPLLGGPRSAVPASASLESGPRVLAAGDQARSPPRMLLADHGSPSGRGIGTPAAGDRG